METVSACRPGLGVGEEMQLLTGVRGGVPASPHQALTPARGDGLPFKSKSVQFRESLADTTE